MTVKHKNIQLTYKDVKQSYYSCLFLIYFKFLFPRSVDRHFDLAFSHMSLVNCNNPDV